MFTISALRPQAMYSQVNTRSVNYSLPIYSISNSSYPLINNETLDLNSVNTSFSADDAHRLAYAAHRKKMKRAAPEKPYSEMTCQKASDELSTLLQVAVAQPSSWYRVKNRVEALQRIVKDADCKTGE